MTKEEKIAKLNNSIEFWNAKLNNTIDNVERGTLVDKIKSAKKEIEDLNTVKQEVKNIVHCDAVPLADRLEQGIDTRNGQRIISNTNSFKINI